MATTTGISTSRPRTGSLESKAKIPDFYNLSAQYRQRLYSYNTQQNTWNPIQNPSPPPFHIFTNIRILSWNIDFSTRAVDKRTQGILNYIESQIPIPIQGNHLDIPLIIMFQEVSSKAIPFLLSNTFIQTHYDLTTISSEDFAAHYGTISCVPKILTPFISSISRFPFTSSEMGRDALIIDIDLPHYPDRPHSFPNDPEPIRVRIANTHLESLRGRSDSERQAQLGSIAKLFSVVHGGLVAGDMNAIAPTDIQLPQSVGLVDCWEVLKSDLSEKDGHTWGYQSGPKNRFPPRRLDKVLISGGLEPVSIERFGVGEELKGERWKMWLTDHYGLLAQVKII